MVEAVASGQTNTGSLLDECGDALFNLGPHARANDQAAAVINVLRQRGLLNDQGVELCRAELGPLSVAVIKENMG